MRRLLVSCMFLFGPMQTVNAAPAESAPATDTSTKLETVLVRGRQPGPGMWRVSKGSHELWILGTLSPLPAGMEWRSRDVEAAIARSQEVLSRGSASGKIGAGTMLKVASLMPAALRTRHNPGGAQLKAVMDPALYLRWSAARDRYVEPATRFEKYRPVYASQELYWSAVRSEGLSTRDVAGPVVVEAAKRHGVPITDTGFSYPLELDRKELKKRIAAVNQASSGDIACFTATLDRLDADLVAMKVRANAWAVGDVGALRGLSRTDFQAPCRAVDDAATAFLGADKLRQRLRANWLSAAERALARNESTFAFLPIADLLDQAGILGELRRKGFQVEAPDDELADGP